MWFIMHVVGSFADVVEVVNYVVVVVVMLYHVKGIVDCVADFVPFRKLADIIPKCESFKLLMPDRQREERKLMQEIAVIFILEASFIPTHRG